MSGIKFACGRTGDDAASYYDLDGCTLFDTLPEAITDCSDRARDCGGHQDPTAADFLQVLRCTVDENGDVQEYRAVTTGEVLATLGESSVERELRRDLAGTCAQLERVSKLAASLAWHLSDMMSVASGGEDWTQSEQAAPVVALLDQAAALNGSGVTL